MQLPYDHDHDGPSVVCSEVDDDCVMIGSIVNFSHYICVIKILEIFSVTSEN